MILPKRYTVPVYEGQKALFAVNTVFLGLSVIAVALRFYARTLKRIPFGVDDWFIVVGTVLTCRSLDHL